MSCRDNEDKNSCWLVKFPITTISSQLIYMSIALACFSRQHMASALLWPASGSIMREQHAFIESIKMGPTFESQES